MHQSRRASQYLRNSLRYYPKSGLFQQAARSISTVTPSEPSPTRTLAVVRKRHGLRFARYMSTGTRPARSACATVCRHHSPCLTLSARFTSTASHGSPLDRNRLSVSGRRCGVCRRLSRHRPASRLTASRRLARPSRLCCGCERPSPEAPHQWHLIGIESRRSVFRRHESPIITAHNVAGRCLSLEYAPLIGHRRPDRWIA